VTDDKHIQDYRRIETNAELVFLSVAVGLDSHGRPEGEVKEIFGVPVRITKGVEPETAFFIPNPESLIRIHEQDPMEDLRRYFGCIRNVKVA
jgi:hypothetical protein